MAMTTEVLKHTSRWMSTFAVEWHDEIPLKIHTRGLDAGGTPKWDPGFAAWLQGGGRNSESRRRITAAMRLLRKRSIREFEVAYRMMVLGEPIEQTTIWLNDRAIRNDKPERYSVKDTQVIIVAAVDKLLNWYY